MHFEYSDKVKELQKRLLAFMNEYVYPNESRMVEHEGLPAELESDLQAKVKALGLYIMKKIVKGDSVVEPREFDGLNRFLKSLEDLIAELVLTFTSVDLPKELFR